MYAGISPMSFMQQFAANPKRVLVVHATYDLTFLEEFSLDVIKNFTEHKVEFVSKVLPCGHYTTGETPYKFMDGWFIGSFMWSTFRRLRKQAAGPAK